MTRVQISVVVVALLLETIVLSGLVVRRRLSRNTSFALYMLSVLLAEALTLFRPEIFMHARPWVLIETLHAMLRHLVAIELAFHTSRAFPGARRRLRVFFWTMTLATLAVPFLSTGDLLSTVTIVTTVLPRLLYTAIWLFTGLGALVLWYRLPLQSMHKAILLGFVAYLVLATFALNLLREWGVVHREITGYLNSLGYVLVLAYWARAAWRRDPTRAVSDAAGVTTP